MNDGRNIIDEIELRLQQLEKEKNEIENLYGINENMIKEYSNNTFMKEVKKIKNKEINKIYSTDLPKLEINIKKENKVNYKTPAMLQDSLKYEPNIKDLISDDEFEPSFKNLNTLKSDPFIPNGVNIAFYIKLCNEEYYKNYIN